MDIENLKYDAEVALAEYGKLITQRDIGGFRSMSKQRMVNEFIDAHLQEYLRLNDLYLSAVVELRVEELVDI